MMSGVGELAGEPRESWWRRWIVAPVKNQLTRGMSVNRVSWTISLGFVLGVFPVMGTTSLVCLLAGVVFRLNQALLHVFKSLVYPLHLALILVFIRLGERLYGAPLITFSIPQLVVKFKDDPLRFGRDFGMAAWHGVSAWLLIAPFAAIIIKWAVTPLVRRTAMKLKGQPA
jgi:cytochrome c biogenesis protein CcdA